MWGGEAISSKRSAKSQLGNTFSLPDVGQDSYRKRQCSTIIRDTLALIGSQPMRDPHAFAQIIRAGWTLWFTCQGRHHVMWPRKLPRGYLLLDGLLGRLAAFSSIELKEGKMAYKKR